MGKVRTQVIKRNAEVLIEKFPEFFSADFEKNKKALGEVAEISSKKLRNRLAGYITNVMMRNIKPNEKEAYEKIGTETPNASG
ncbi:MAG: 30S ribosomal protein S17e [Thermoproteota archaeon]|nr:30S ribosomal protein S17e [Thermoproteota archaeon]